MAAVLVIVMVACAFQGSIGFGANLIAQPIVYQLEPDLVPGPVLMATALLSGLVLVRERQAMRFTDVGTASLGTVAGTGAGAAVVGIVSEEALAVVIALCVLAMVAISAVGSAPRRSRRNQVIAGTAGGFGSTTAGIGGPPVALLVADAEGPEARGFLAGYFLVTSTLTFAGLAVAGRFGPEHLRAGAVLLPAALCGFGLSGPLLPIVDRGATRPTVLAVSGLAAITLLARTLLGR